MEDLENELSTTVLQGLKNFGDSIPIDLTEKLIKQSVKLIIHPTATIAPIPEIYSTNADRVKQSEYAIVTLFAVATRKGTNEKTLKELLDKLQLNSVAVDIIVRYYEDNRKDLIFRSMQLGYNFPHITDIQWRIMCDAKSSTSDCSSGEINFNINLGHYSTTGERKTIVEFICNREELQLLINKLKDIERHCENVAADK